MINTTSKLLEAKNFAILKNGLCLSEQYINSTDKLEWKCSHPEHPTWFSSFKNVIYVKRWCPICGIESRRAKRKNQHGLEQAQLHAKNKHGQCLSSEYIGAHHKLEWKCSNLEHPSWFAAFNDVVRRNKWCSVCGKESSILKRTNKNGLEQAQLHAKNKHGLCLSSEYISARHKLEWKCSNPDHPSWLAAFDSVINANQWCVNCAHEKNFSRWRNSGLKKAYLYAKSRGGQCLSTKFISGSNNLEWKCSNPEHPSWFKSFHQITSKKSWCSKCVGESIQEFKVRNILNFLFDTNFIKTQSLDWNINPKTGKILELDGYSDSLRIAFEFQGYHHYELVFNQTENDLQYIKYKDSIKKQNCFHNNIKLIVINEIKKNNFNDFYAEILNGLDKADIDIPEHKKTNIVKLKEIYHTYPINDQHKLYLKEAKKHALAKNGKCLSSKYVNSREKLEWKCSNPDHSSWFALFHSVVRNKSWCSKCSRENKK